MSKERARCGATLIFGIEESVFHCQKNAGHKGPHEEAGDVGSKYRQYLMRWRGDCRDTCDACHSRTERVVKCMNCDLLICLNCRDPHAVEQLKNICKTCPPEEGDDD